MFCRNCGSQMNDEALFCNNCGWKKTDEPINVVVEENKIKPKKNLVKNIIVEVVLFIAVFGIFFIFNLKPSDSYYYYFDENDNSILHLTSKNINNKIIKTYTFKVKQEKNSNNYQLYYGKKKIDNIYDVDTFLNSGHDIRRVIIDDILKLDSTSYMFYGLWNVEKINVELLDVSRTSQMIDMFNDCQSLTSLEVKGWKTGSVSAMGNMFVGCSSLKSIDVSKWKTKSVNSMCGMFNGCSSLKSIEVDKWDTSKVVDMGYMFYNCRSLKNINVEKWNTSNVKNMDYMFSNCYSLEKINIKNWNMDKVENKKNMFEGSGIRY